MNPACYSSGLPLLYPPANNHKGHIMDSNTMDITEETHAFTIVEGATRGGDELISRTAWNNWGLRWQVYLDWAPHGLYRADTLQGLKDLIRQLRIEAGLPVRVSKYA